MKQSNGKRKSPSVERQLALHLRRMIECVTAEDVINKHENKKLKEGRGAVGKQAVLGMRERNGNTKAMPIPNLEAGTIQTAFDKRR